MVAVFSPILEIILLIYATLSFICQFYSLYSWFGVYIASKSNNSLCSHDCADATKPCKKSCLDQSLILKSGVIRLWILIPMVPSISRLTGIVSELTSQCDLAYGGHLLPRLDTTHAVAKPENFFCGDNYHMSEN